MSAVQIGGIEGVPLSEEEWKRHRQEAVASLPDELKGGAIPDVLLPFQKRLLLSTAKYQLTVADKSRRTGATWAVGADAVLTSSMAKPAGGMDTLYLGYNLDMAREFIDTCAMWARAFSIAADEVGEFLFADGQDSKGQDRNIQAFRIRFSSGHEIVALSSRPRSLRGRQGYVILDEFAFHDDADELLKAAIALLIWGGKILVISTHNGEENPFNKLIQDIRAGKQPGNVVRCTFDDAIRDGLYQRVCLVRGIDWTAEGEAAWREAIRKTYRAHAAEELDCIPSAGTGVYLPRVVCEACTVPGLPVLRFNSPKGFVLQPEVFRRGLVDEWLEKIVAPEIAKLDKRNSHSFAQDFARKGDLSVLGPIATLSNLVRRVPFVIELRDVPFEQQKQIVIFLIERLPRFHAGKMDATGNGAYLAEVTMQRFGSVIEPITLNQGWYLENMPKLKSAIEDRMFEYPADDYLTDDLTKIRNQRGIPMVPADARGDDRDGGERHGDFAVFAALGYAASLSDVIEHHGYQSAAKHESPFGKGGRDYGGGGWSDRADQQESAAPFGKGAW